MDRTADQTLHITEQDLQHRLRSTQKALARLNTRYRNAGVRYYLLDPECLPEQPQTCSKAEFESPVAGEHKQPNIAVAITMLYGHMDSCSAQADTSTVDQIYELLGMVRVEVNNLSLALDAIEAEVLTSVHPQADAEDVSNCPYGTVWADSFIRWARHTREISTAIRLCTIAGTNREVYDFMVAREDAGEQALTDESEIEFDSVSDFKTIDDGQDGLVRHVNAIGQLVLADDGVNYRGGLPVMPPPALSTPVGTINVHHRNHDLMYLV